MAMLPSLLVLSLVLFGFISAEPDFCKRGAKVSAAYLHCFRQAHYKFPYGPLHQPRDVVDGCFVEAYANHTCRVVKPAALDCFRRNISRCDQRERLFSIADESGGACFGSHINRIFKEHVLNFLEPVRGDSECFPLGDRAYECYGHAGSEMAERHPDLDLLSVDDYIPVANEFFDSIYNCFIKIYSSNRPLCENWQIPMLLELQGTALPSLFGMSFTADQMDKLELHRGCPVQHLFGVKPYWRNCYDESDSDSISSKGHPVSSSSSSSDNDSSPEEQQQDQGLQEEEQEEQEEQQQDQGLQEEEQEEQEEEQEEQEEQQPQKKKKKKKKKTKKKKNKKKKPKNKTKKKKKPKTRKNRKQNKKQKAQTRQEKASPLLQTRQKKASPLLQMRQEKASPLLQTRQEKASPLSQTQQNRQPSSHLLKRLQEEIEKNKESA